MKTVSPEVVLKEDYSSSYGHGTAMALCFHEFEPEAEIYLIDSQFGNIDVNIINYFTINGILLVSESLNMENFLHATFLNGNEYLSLSLDNCVNSSITVCTIAGNYANSSYFAHLNKR